MHQPKAGYQKSTLFAQQTSLISCIFLGIGFQNQSQYLSHQMVKQKGATTNAAMKNIQLQTSPSLFWGFVWSACLTCNSIYKNDA